MEEKQVHEERVSVRTPLTHPLGIKLHEILYYLLGVAEILLLFRFFLKLFGANPLSGFAAFIYRVTNPLVAPFLGIFRRAATEGIETTAILEPATLIAMAVYAVAVWIVARLITILTTPPPSTTGTSRTP